jgi:mono/diheme cytochrome c family protein
MRRVVIGLAAAVLVNLGGCQEGTVDGPTLYTRNCAACHAGDLSGSVGPAIGPGSASASQSDEQLRSVVINGARGMPATRLDAEQLDALVAHIRTLQAG